MSAPPASNEVALPLGVVAGSGQLPRELLESCLSEGRPVFVLAIEGETSPETVEGVPHVWVRLGALGEALDHLRRAGARELVLAGKITRPSLSLLLPDKTGARLLSRLGFSLFGGDAAIFKTIVAFLEEEGFHVLATHEVMGELVAPEGPLGQHLPDRQAQKDIELGARVVEAIGAFDVGQAVIVKSGLVLGIEAAEGTDALIERCAALKGEGRGGVLVKARKPIQEDRVDLPTIGAETLEHLHQAGFAGVAVEARHSLVVDRRETIRLADALGLFVIGFTHRE